MLVSYFITGIGLAIGLNLLLDRYGEWTDSTSARAFKIAMTYSIIVVWPALVVAAGCVIVAIKIWYKVTTWLIGKRYKQIWK